MFSRTLVMASVFAASLRGMPAAANDPCEQAVTPNEVTISLGVGETYTLEKCICLDPVPPKIDVMIAIDLTGSMGEEMNNLKAEIINIINTVRAGTTEDLAFGLSSYEDYDAYYSSCGYAKRYGYTGDEPFRVDAPIGGSDPASDAAVAAAVQALSLGNGADTPECYGRLVWEAGQPDSGMNFRPGALKILVNFGDSIPHDCDLRTGLTGCNFTFYTGRDPGRDMVAFTPDDIDWQSNALPAAIAAKVKLIQVHSGTSAQLCGWQQWAAMTGGTAFKINADGTIPGGVDLPDLLLDLIATAAASVGELKLMPAAGCPLVITTDPPSLGPLDVTEGWTGCLEETIRVPVDIDPFTNPVVCTVDVVADGAVIGQQQITVNVTDNQPPAITCNATGGIVSGNCEYVVNFSATVTDNFCLLPGDVTVNVSLSGGAATLDTPVLNKTASNSKTVQVSGSVRVSAVTDSPVNVLVTFDAVDCSGNAATTCSREAVVSAAGGPAITTQASGGSVGPDCSRTVTFAGTVQDSCCVLAEDVTVHVSLAGGSATLGAPVVNKAQAGNGRVEVTGSVEVFDVLDGPVDVQVAINAVDCDQNAAPQSVAHALVSDAVAPTITSSASAQAAGGECQFVVNFDAVVEDPCCVQADDVTIDVAVAAGSATLGQPSYTKTPVGDTRVEIVGSVPVSRVLDSPATVRVTVGASDCDGHVATASVATTDVVDTAGPTITGAATATAGDECEYTVSFDAVVDDPCCVLASGVTVDAAIVSGAATLGQATYTKTQVGDDRVQIIGSVPVSALITSPTRVQVTISAADCDGHAAVPCVVSADVNDLAGPVVTSSATATQTGDGCQFLVTFNGTVEDTCCVRPEDVTVAFNFLSGSGTLDPNPTITKTQDGIGRVLVAGSVLVTELIDCPATVEVRMEGKDCGGHWGPPVSATVALTDSVPPVIDCPPPLNLESGSAFCDSSVDDWLGAATATDNCDPDPELSYDIPPGGFRYGTTTLVRFTATDRCGNSNTCNASVRIGAAPRVDGSKKGSLLIFPKVELRWDASGNLLQDTFIQLVNDGEAGVAVALYFVNGDPPVPPGSIPGERAHEGWNSLGGSILLTADEPAYWSALSGLPEGVSPFTLLDPGTPPGRPDPEGSGERVLRGFILAWAVNADGHEIAWNHLSGNALVIHYGQHHAWEYNAWAAAAHCVDEGAEPLDCLEYDAFGICIAAQTVPGNIALDGFQYDFAPDRVLIDFFASGATILDSGSGRQFTADTDLTLLPVDVDLRQDDDGPTATLAEFNIWNMNEVKFSGAQKCITCWDQALLSRYPSPRHFLRNNLQTDRGKARIEGRSAFGCTDSVNTALLGVKADVLRFGANPKPAWAGTSVTVQGTERALIRFDVPGSDELRGGPHAGARPGAPGNPTPGSVAGGETTSPPRGPRR